MIILFFFSIDNGINISIMLAYEKEITYGCL